MTVSVKARQDIHPLGQGIKVALIHQIALVQAPENKDSLYFIGIKQIFRQGITLVS